MKNSSTRHYYFLQCQNSFVTCRIFYNIYNICLFGVSCW